MEGLILIRFLHINCSFERQGPATAACGLCDWPESLLAVKLTVDDIPALHSQKEHGSCAWFI